MAQGGLGGLGRKIALHHQQVARRGPLQRKARLRRAQRRGGFAGRDHGVFARLSHEDDREIRGDLFEHDQLGFERLDRQTPGDFVAPRAAPDRRREPARQPGPCHGHRLVCALAAKIAGEGAAENRRPWPGKIHDGERLVECHVADDEGLHHMFLLT